MLLSRALRRQAPIAAVVAVVAAVAMASPAAAATSSTDVNFACQARSSQGGLATGIRQPISVRSPETVAPGDEFDIVIAPGSAIAPPSVGGVEVTRIRNGKLIIPIPEGVEYEGADLSGGKNIGSRPSIVKDGDRAIVRFAGPIAGNDPFTLPTVTEHLKATGRPGQEIKTEFGGIGYNNPDLTFTSTGSVSGADVDYPTACYASPSTTLSTVTIDDES